MKQGNARYTGPSDIRFLPVPDDLAFSPTDHSLCGPGGPRPEPMNYGPRMKAKPDRTEWKRGEIGDDLVQVITSHGGFDTIIPAGSAFPVIGSER